MVTEGPDRADPVGALIDYLSGSPEENAQHLIMRRAFLNVFLHDPQVSEFLQGWHDETLLWELKSYLEKVIDGEKTRYWDEVLDPDGMKNLDLRNNPLILESLASPETVDLYCGGVIERALQAVSGQGGDPMWGSEPAWPDFLAEAKRFVAGLGLPYPWLVIALLGEFGRRSGLADIVKRTCSTTYLGSGFPRWEWAYELEPSRPQPAAAVEAISLRDSTQDALTKWAVWFYRAEIRGQPIRSIARAEFGICSDRRSDIKRGIARAKELLALTVHGVPEDST